MKSQWKFVRGLGCLIGVLGILMVLLAQLLGAGFATVFGCIFLVFGGIMVVVSSRSIKVARDVPTLRDGEIRFNGLVAKSTVVDIPLQVSAMVSYYAGSVSIVIGSQIFNINTSQVLGAETYGARTNAAGAVITGVTGVDAKQCVTQHFYIYISFTSTSGEASRIDLEVFPPMKSVYSFIETITPQQSVAKQL